MGPSMLQARNSFVLQACKKIQGSPPCQAGFAPHHQRSHRQSQSGFSASLFWHTAAEKWLSRLSSSSLALFLALTHRSVLGKYSHSIFQLLYVLIPCQNASSSEHPTAGVSACSRRLPRDFPRLERDRRLQRIQYYFRSVIREYTWQSCSITILRGIPG